jgi:hypothetical protein
MNALLQKTLLMLRKRWNNQPTRENRNHRRHNVQKLEPRCMLAISFAYETSSPDPQLRSGYQHSASASNGGTVSSVFAALEQYTAVPPAGPTGRGMAGYRFPESTQRSISADTDVKASIFDFSQTWITRTAPVLSSRADGLLHASTALLVVDQLALRASTNNGYASTQVQSAFYANESDGGNIHFSFDAARTDSAIVMQMKIYRRLKDYLYEDFKIVSSVTIPTGASTYDFPIAIQPKSQEYLISVRTFFDNSIGGAALNRHGSLNVSWEVTAPHVALTAQMTSLAYSIGTLAIKSDPGSGLDYSGPAYSNVNGSTKSSPVLFTASSYALLIPHFIITTPNYGSVLVRGDGPGNLDVAAVRSDYSVSWFSGAYNTQDPSISAWFSSSFGSDIRYYDSFAINWQMSSNGGETWYDAGASRHQAYVAASTPRTANLFHSVVDIAVRSTVGGSYVNQNGIRDAVWAEFADRTVRRVDGNQLFYYGNPATSEPDNNGVVTTEDLLQTGNGQCGSWVQLFLDCLAVNGVVGGLHVRVEPINRNEEMLVKTYEFLGAGRSGKPSYPFIALSEVKNVLNDSVIRPIDVIDKDGIPGQGTNRPISQFQNHQLALVGGRYYDPSYGVSYGSLAQMEAQSIAGFVLAYPQGVILVEAIVGDVDGVADNNVYVGGAFLARKEDATRAELQVAYAFPYPLAASTVLTASDASSSNAVGSELRTIASTVEPEGDSVRGNTAVNGRYDYIYAAEMSFKSERFYVPLRKTSPAKVVQPVEGVPIHSVSRLALETARSRSEQTLLEDNRDASVRDAVFCGLGEEWQIKPWFRKSLLSRVGA